MTTTHESRMNTWSELPRLAVGSHKRGEHRGCLMNVISWANGDVEITDYPSCTHPMLARAAQVVNDSLCRHRDGDFLCSDCSAVVYAYEPLLVDTAPPEDETEAKRLFLHMILALQPLVAPLWPILVDRPPVYRPPSSVEQRCAQAWNAARDWDRCPCPTHTVRAWQAAQEVGPRDDRLVVALARDVAIMPFQGYPGFLALTVSKQAVDVVAAYWEPTRYRRQMLDLLIDAYYEWTNKPKAAPDVERLKAACELAGMR